MPALIAFLFSPIGRYVALGVAAVLLAGGAYFYIDHKARVDERNAAIARTLKETEDARRSREKVERIERDRTDDDATKCLRSPTGC